MKTPVPRYTHLASKLNRLIDEGQVLPIEEMRRGIDDGYLFDRLGEFYGGEPHNLDLSVYGPGERREILDMFDRTANAYDTEHDLGITHNGLALILAYCLIEIGSAGSQ